MLRLLYDTPSEWVEVVACNLGEFLRDHAHNERRVAGSAMQLVIHHPNEIGLVTFLVDLAREELSHFKQVLALLNARGISLGHKKKDAYMGAMHQLLRRDNVREYLLDRLLLFGIIEARGYERFRLLGIGLEDEHLAQFYRQLAVAETRHQVLFVDKAKELYVRQEVDERLNLLLGREAEIASSIPLRPALH